MSSAMRGALTMLVATALIALSTLFAKMLTTGPDALSPFQVSWGRYLFGFLLLNIFVMVTRPKFTLPNWSIHAIRVFCGWGGVTCMFGATAFIPLGDVSAISFTNPIFAMLFAIPILGERIGRVRWMTAGLALFGAVLLVRPGTSSFQPAALIALVAAVLLAMELVMIKILTSKESVFQLIYVANGAALVISSAVVIWFWQTPTLYEFGLLAGLGAVSILVQTFNIHAYRAGEASAIASLDYTRLVYALIIGLLLFGDWPDETVFIGAAIIIAAALYTIHREARAGQKLTRIDENTGISGSEKD